MSRLAPQPAVRAVAKLASVLVANSIVSRLLRIPAPEPVQLELEVPSAATKKPTGRSAVECDSDGTSSEDEGAVDKTSRVLQRQRKRQQKYSEAALNAFERGVSLFEEKSIKPATVKRYQAEFDALLAFGRGLGNSLKSPSSFENVMIQYFHHLFFQGEQSSKGDYVAASVMHHVPALSRLGSVKMPRVWRALKGWRALCPPRSRMPETFAFWAGVVNLLYLSGQIAMGIFVLMSLSTYLRPSQLLSTVTESLVAPNRSVSAYWTLLVHPEEGISRSKTGEADVSFVLDSSYLRFLEPIYQLLKNRAKHLKIFNFTYPEYAKALKKMSVQLGVPFTAYQTRHSGASIDRSRGVRTRPEVQARGQWKAERSVARYDKHARLAQSFEKHPLQLQNYFRECEARIEDIVVFGRTVTPPAMVAMPR